MPCTPQNTPLDPSCVNQTLILNADTGDLSISNGNTVNLADTVQTLETKTQLVSLTLTGTILQAIYLGEDGIQQAKNVDLSSLLSDITHFNVEATNSISLGFDGVNLRADLIIDPASTLPVSASLSGVLFNCCPETPITANTTNTVQLVASGGGGHVLAANLKYQDSNSINFSDSSLGLSGSIKYSTDANNAATAGTDGALWVATASSQLASLPNNGFVTTGNTGTLLVGSDSKLYRIADPLGEQPIIGSNTNTANVIASGPDSHTIAVNVNLVTSNSIQLSSTTNGIQADLKIDTSTPGNVGFTIDSNGLVGNITENSILAVQNSIASVQNPITKVFGNLNNGAGGYANVFISQYGIKIPSFTTSGRFAIPVADLYDSLLVFDTSVRAYFWYDAVNSIWIQIGQAGTTPTIGNTIKINGVVDAGGSAFASGTTYVNNAMVNFPVEVYRNKLMEPDTNPGNGDSFFTKNLSSNTITFSSALTPGELVQVIILPS